MRERRQFSDGLTKNKALFPIEVTLVDRFEPVGRMVPVRARVLYTGMEVDDKLPWGRHPTLLKGVWFKGTILEGNIKELQVGEEFRAYYSFEQYNRAISKNSTPFELMDLICPKIYINSRNYFSHNNNI